MSIHQQNQIRPVQEQLWTLSTDRKTVRLQLPQMIVDGVTKPLNVHLDLNARTVDDVIARLTVLRAQMLPALPAPAKLN